MKKLQIISAICLIMQTLMMIVYRGHYVIDIIAGFIFAHYFYDLASDIDKIIFLNYKQNNLIRRNDIDW